VFNIYKYACKTSDQNLLTTCTPRKHLLIKCLWCHELDGRPIGFAFDMYSEQNSILYSTTYLSIIEAYGR